MASDLQPVAPTARTDAPSDAFAAPPPQRGGFVRFLNERKWLLVGLVLVGAAVGLVVALVGDRQYTSQATLLVGSPVGGGGSTAAVDSVETERRLAELPAVAQRASQMLADVGRRVGARDADERTDVETRGDDVLVISAHGSDPRETQQLASAYANAHLAHVREAEMRRIGDVIQTLEEELAAVGQGLQAEELEKRIAALRQSRAQAGRGAALVGKPPVPSEADGREIPLHLAVGAGLALPIALLLAGALQRVDRRIRRPEDLEEIYGLPTLAKVPRSSELTGDAPAQYGRPDVSSLSGFGREAEAFRQLRANLRYFPRSRMAPAAGERSSGLGSLLVVSPLPGEGKSTIARLLAVTMAAMGDRVCLVDADLRKGDLSLAAGSRPEGLSLVLAGFDLDESLSEVPAAVDPVFGESRVLVELRSGALPPNPSELLESERMRWTLSELEKRFDTVIIDSPAIASVSDALALVHWVSGVLVVSSLGHTTRNAARELRQQLSLLGARPVGLVVNRWRPEREYAYHYEHPAAAAQAAREAQQQ